MKISVLIPTYNRMKFLPITLINVQQQVYKDLEIIFYDDGSTDNTIAFLKQEQKKDNRIKIIEGKINKGVGYARNALISACNTQFAVWWDTDDVCNIYRIEIQLKHMPSSGKLVFCNWEKWRGYNNQHKEEQLPIINSHVDLGFATLMFPVDKEILFDTDKPLGGEDWNWISKMLSKYLVIALAEVMYYINFHGNRIGTWKRKILPIIDKKLLKTLSYQQLIDFYYNKKYEKEN